MIQYTISIGKRRVDISLIDLFISTPMICTPVIDDYAEANGLKIHFQEYPRENATGKIVLLHCGGEYLSMWYPMLPHLGDYHLLLVDLRGHGFSDKPERGYHLDDMADDVMELMKQRKFFPAYLLGSSLGMGTSLSLAARYPEMVLAVMGEGGFNNTSGPYGKIQTEQEIEEYQKQWETYRDQYTRPLFDSVEQRVVEKRKFFKQQGWDFSSEIEESVRYSTVRVGEKYSDPFEFRVMDEINQVYLAIRFENYHQKIQCPVGFFPDKNDMKDSNVVRAMEAFASMLPYCEIIAIKDAVHAYISYAKPKIYAEEVLRFIMHANTWISQQQ